MRKIIGRLKFFSYNDLDTVQNSWEDGIAIGQTLLKREYLPSSRLLMSTSLSKAVAVV